MRTQAWLEEVTRALPQVLRRVFGSSVKPNGLRQDWFRVPTSNTLKMKVSLSASVLCGKELI